MSFTSGLVEVGGGNLSILQTGQFGRVFDGRVTVTAARLGGAPRINGFLRSETDPDGAAYYVAIPAAGVARVFRIVGHSDGGAQMSVSLDGDVPISPTEPAHLVHADRVVSARLETPPFTSRGAAVVTSVTYWLSARERASAESAGNRLGLPLHNGTAYRRYAVRRTGFLE